MSDAAEKLKTTTDKLLRNVVGAAVASKAADDARAKAAPNLFEIAQAHRKAEKLAHDSLDECIKAARAAWDAGEITLGVRSVPAPDEQGSSPEV